MSVLVAVDNPVHTAAGLVTDMLGQYVIAGTPLGDHIAAITLDGQRIFTNPTPRVHTPLTAPHEPSDLVEDPWAEPWWNLAEHLATLDGPWLHPETRNTTGDGYALATWRAALSIGCVDRNNPDDGRPKYRPDLNPHFNDLGVIDFPLNTFATLTEITAWAPADAAARVAAAEITEAFIHEAFELTQTEPGVCVVNPHRADRPWPCTITFHTGTRTLDPIGTR